MGIDSKVLVLYRYIDIEIFISFLSYISLIVYAFQVLCPFYVSCWHTVAFSLSFGICGTRTNVS